MYEFYKQVYPNKSVIDVDKNFIDNYNLVSSIGNINEYQNNDCDLNKIYKIWEVLLPIELKIIQAIKHFNLEEKYKNYFCFIIDKYKYYSRENEIMDVIDIAKSSNDEGLKKSLNLYLKELNEKYKDFEIGILNEEDLINKKIIDKYKDYGYKIGNLDEFIEDLDLPNTQRNIKKKNKKKVLNKKKY
jgi:hypothetical protein